MEVSLLKTYPIHPFPYKGFTILGDGSVVWNDRGIRVKIFYPKNDDPYFKPKRNEKPRYYIYEVLRFSKEAYDEKMGE